MHSNICRIRKSRGLLLQSSRSGSCSNRGQPAAIVSRSGSAAIVDAELDLVRAGDIVVACAARNLRIAPCPQRRTVHFRSGLRLPGRDADTDTDPADCGSADASTLHGRGLVRRGNAGFLALLLALDRGNLGLLALPGVLR